MMDGIDFLYVDKYQRKYKMEYYSEPSPLQDSVIYNIFRSNW